MRETRPLVSALMAVWNNERYVESAVRSLMGQSYGPMEIIVADDGSDDRTFEVLEGLRPEAGARFSRVVFGRRPHLGVSPALAWAAERAEGEYLFLLGSDDLARPQAVERLLGFLEGHPDHALAAGDADLIGPDGEPVRLNREGQLWREGDGAAHARHADFLRSISHGTDFLSDEFGSYWSLLHGNYLPSSSLIRRSAYQAVGGYDARYILEDWHMGLKLARRYRLKFFPEILYSYRRHPGATMVKKAVMLKALAQTIDLELQLIEAEGTEAERLLAKNFLANRTTRIERLAVGPWLRLSVEKFGLGEFFATRETVLELFGRAVWRRRKKYLAYHDGLNQPLSRNLDPTKPDAPA